jgi:hypothetical protein
MSSQSDPVLQLGKKIVDQMGIQRSVDTLGRWMAHYVAELISEADSSHGQTKIDAQKRCREAILDLWQHRYELPDGLRPFQDLEAIAETLASLDLTPGFPRYFDKRLRSTASESETESARWLDIAAGLDRAAKVLIRYSLSQAAEAAVVKSEEWVHLAEHAGFGSGIESVIIRFVSQEADVLNGARATAERRKEIEDRLSRLKAFRGTASLLEADLEERLAGLPASEMEPGSTNVTDIEVDL